jgi:L-lactate dehydrogenase complex protein LldF
MEIRCNQFQELSKKALNDQNLQEALKNFSTLIQEKRNKAFSLLDNSEGLREQAHNIKKETLERLDEYLEHLEKNVIRLDGKVHWARDAKKARELVETIASDKGVKTVVKGKSMVTEEIDLNKELIARGIEVSETDLGEFIIQLAEEPPSHLVGPAIHKTKEQIAELFSEKLGVRLMEDPQEMTMVARNALRDKFIQADMGITGVNFAVAETGSIVLLENEGNIRLSTTLPKIHVAIMGIEKVIPNLEDLNIFLKLLARSTTGQKLSSYTSIITGPKRDGESDGAEEFHLIILDNGRSKILADEELRETLYCIRCGACLDFCPVYLKIGGHSYGWVYSGPIGSILTPQLINRKQAYQLPFASSLCGACVEVCPVKINIPKILLTLRRRMIEDPQWGKPSIAEKTVFALYAYIMRNKWLYETVSRMARFGQIPFIKKGILKNLPPPLNRWTHHHEVVPLEKSFRQQWKEFSDKYEES